MAPSCRLEAGRWYSEICDVYLKKKRSPHRNGGRQRPDGEDAGRRFGDDEGAAGAAGSIRPSKDVVSVGQLTHLCDYFFFKWRACWSNVQIMNPSVCTRN